MWVVGCCLQIPPPPIFMRGGVDCLSVLGQQLCNEIHVWKVKSCQIFTTESSSAENLKVYILLPDLHIFTAAGGKVELRTGHPYKRAECSWCSQMEQVRPGRVPKPLQTRLKRKSGEAGLRSAWQPTATGLHCLGLMSHRMIRRLDGGMSAELWQTRQLTADTLGVVGGCGGVEPVRNPNWPAGNHSSGPTWLLTILTGCVCGCLSLFPQLIYCVVDVFWSSL